MKNFKTIGLTAFAALSLIFTSCSSDSDGDDTGIPEGTNSFIHATVDGGGFQTIEVQGHSTAMASKVVAGDHTFITVTGSSMTASTIIITLEDITATGTYTFNASTNSALSFADATGKVFGSNNCDAGTATLNVTHIDNAKIEGTFTFTGKEEDNCSGTKNVTEGSFRGVFTTS